MNESIMTWSSQEVYGGQLVADETVKSHTIKDFGGDNAMILLFIDTAGCDMPEAEPGT
jgi:superfamily I DNA and/or RNA helicase